MNARSPKTLFSRALAAAPGRLHLAAHSHHLWPDASRDGQLEAWDDAARLADRKWERVFGEVLPDVARRVAAILGLPGDGRTLAFAPNTHELVVRVLSALPADGSAPRRLRIVTTGSEFHSFARQVARLEEDGLVEVERVPSAPVETLAARLRGACARAHADLVYVSQTFFDSGLALVDLAPVAALAEPGRTAVVVDGYHAFHARPVDLGPVADGIFYVAGSYKYAMGGEGACFLHAPDGWLPRPRVTGWFAAFGALASGGGGVAYAEGGGRFLGATFDPSALYRVRAVLHALETAGLDVPAIHAHVVGLEDRFLAALAAQGSRTLTEERLAAPRGAPGRAHFLAFRHPEAQALQQALEAADVITDARGDRLRVGFGLYHDADDADRAAERLVALVG